MKRPALLAELFAGTAAFTRYVLGAPMELVSWLGGKRRLAPMLARAAGLRRGVGADAVLLSDAGTWGWVWPVLLNPKGNAAVVAVLRRWATTCPACNGSGRNPVGARCVVCIRARYPGAGPDASDLWAWLASQPPRTDLAEATAGWLWLQARSASGAPVWWDADRAALLQGSAEGRPPQPAGERQSGWRKGQSDGRPDTFVGQQGDGNNNGRLPAWRMGDKNGKPAQLLQQAGDGNEHSVAQGWRMGEEPSKARRATRTLSETGRGLTQKGQSADILGSGGTPTIYGDQQTLQGWLMSDGRGVPRTASEKGRGLPTRARGIIYPATLANRIEALGVIHWPVTAILHGSATEAAELVAAFLTLQAANGRGRPVKIRDGRWATAGFAHLSQNAREKGFTERLHLSRLANRVDRLIEVPWPPTGTYQGCASDVVDLVAAAGGEAVAFLDGPYHRDGDQDRDRTGYGWDLPLKQTLQIAARLGDAGARVLITEGGPLARDLGPGWHSYDLTEASSGVVKGREWLTVNARADLGLAEQTSLLFAGGAA